MKCVEELENKVLHVIQKNAELKVKVEELVCENEDLKKQVSKFEESLLQKQNATSALESEKIAVQNIVEGLLNTINRLESSSNLEVK